jgi:DNA-binding HxlR family transcriptional regulator
MVPRGNVFDPDSGSRAVLDLIADKWTAIAVHALAGGTKRHSELMRVIGGISAKVLTQTLRGLEKDGLVERKVYAVVPPRTEYTLTPLGQSLEEPLSDLCRWAELHLADVEAGRAAATRPATAPQDAPSFGSGSSR